jgi:lipopolysaccharide transport system permease protein
MVAGIGFFAALLNSVMRDIGSILGIVMGLGMFATPIVYPPPATWPLSFWINYVNPVSGFVLAARDLTTVGSLSDPGNYVSSVVLSILLFFVGWRLFHLVEPKIAERI